MGMIDVQCRVCGGSMRVSSTAKSGVCSTCVLSGKFVPPPTPAGAPEFPVVPPPPTEPQTSPVDNVSSEPSTPPVEPPAPRENVGGLIQESGLSPELPKEKTKSLVEKKPKKTKKEQAPHGEKTARVNRLIQDGKDVSAILKVLQSEYPSCDEKSLRNLIYVQRYRLDATKKRKGGKRG